MDITEIRNLIIASIGRSIKVTPVCGDPQLLSVVSVDQEGFTYYLLEQGQEESTLHWWPLNEVTEVHRS